MKNPSQISAFGWIGRALTLVSLVATLVVVSPGLADTLGAGESRARTAVAWGTALAVALILDTAWVGGLTLLARSMLARKRALATVAGALVALAVVASAAALHVYGGMWLLSAPPVVGMAFLALDVWATATLSDTATEALIRDMDADGRNRSALAEATVRRMRLDGELAAVEETAGTLALAHQGRARALALTSAQVTRMETESTVRDTLAAASKRTGVAIPQGMPAHPSGTGEIAVGTGVSASSGTGSGTGPGTGSGTVDLKALATRVFGSLVVDGDEMPPSLRRFRAAMRAEMDALGLRGSWDAVDALYEAECDRLAAAVND